MSTPTPPPHDSARRRLYAREDALLKRLQSGEDTPELHDELEAIREAIRLNLRHENGFDDVPSDEVP